MQKFIIFMAAIIFAAAGLLIGMSYKELFPPSEKNTRAVQVQPVTTADREETAVAKEPATPEKAAATEKTPTPRESESQEDKTETAPAETAPPEKPQTADNQEKEKATGAPVSVMEELIETQFHEIESLKKELEGLKQELMDKNDQIQSLENRAGQGKTGTKALKPVREPIVLLGDDLFSPGQVTLSPKGQDLVQGLAAKIKSRNNYRLLICGHTDNTNLGPAKAKIYNDNLGLSVARAAVVARGLVSAGVPQEMIGVCGYGDSRPAVPNDSASNMARNRRVVVRFLAMDSEL